MRTLLRTYALCASVILACLFSACPSVPTRHVTESFTAPAVTNEESTIVIDVKAPRAIENVKRISNSAAVDAAIWQVKNPDIQVESLRPVIEEGKLAKWQARYTKVDPKDRKFVFTGYVNEETPFEIPQGVSEEALAGEMLRILSKNIDCPHPSLAALNVKTIDDRRVVLGMWYNFTNPAMGVGISKTGALWTRSPKRRYDTMAEASAAAERNRNLTLAMPKSAVPELAVAWNKVLGIEGDAVMMAPFKTSADKILFHLSGPTDERNRFVEMSVDLVKEGTPYADAGLKVGMIVESMGGIQLAGLTKENFDERVVRGTFKKDIIFTVRDHRSDPSREIVVPIKALIEYERKKPAVLAGGPQ
ncbi:MAG TPA: hypothetical protein VIR98_01465 [Candidatus Paceibacterota bacterium]